MKQNMQQYFRAIQASPFRSAIPILTAPGMWMQNFTTNEPDDSMIECAIRSLELVIPEEKGKDAW